MVSAQWWYHVMSKLFAQDRGSAVIGKRTSKHKQMYFIKHKMITQSDTHLTTTHYICKLFVCMCMYIYYIYNEREK